nr:2S globulin, glycoside hydrolase, catalytic domain-containing protein [Tanacetum cinerariifolium]
MTIQKIVIHVNKPQPLLDQQNSNNSRFAEVAGGTTAECAAVCCCFPIGLVNLLVLAAYGVPAGLYRKALKRKRRRKMLKKGGCGGDNDVDGDRSSCDGEELLIGERVFSYGVVT